MTVYIDNEEKETKTFHYKYLYEKEKRLYNSCNKGALRLQTLAIKQLVNGFTNLSKRWFDW